jgi:Cu(I)/Ag(I) efflux system membrane fusion protein
MKTAINFLLAALLLSSASCTKPTKSNKPPNVDHYTCTMHPSVHAEAPGKCPICGMDLVPVMKKGSSDTTAEPSSQVQGHMHGMEGMPGMPGMKSGGETQGAQTHEFVVPVERQQQIGVTYATVQTKPLRHSIRAVGRVMPEAQRVWSFVARVEGRAAALCHFAREIVAKDAPLISIYSPELLTTERELVMLLRCATARRTAAMRATP